jgi:uncharacterized protein YbjT (DUF2867 family)
MSIVITGASGNLGRRTAELLLETDGVNAADVVLLTRSPNKLSIWPHVGHGSATATSRIPTRCLPRSPARRRSC